jgi:hypothetical protein
VKGVLLRRLKFQEPLQRRNVATAAAISRFRLSIRSYSGASAAVRFRSVRFAAAFARALIRLGKPRARR